MVRVKRGLKIDWNDEVNLVHTHRSNAFFCYI